MSSRTKTLATLAIAALGALGVSAPAAGAEAKPAWQLSLRTYPTDIAPGVTLQPKQEPLQYYTLIVENVGGGPAEGPITMTVQLPEGISPASLPAEHHSPSVENPRAAAGNKNSRDCPVADRIVTCTLPETMSPGESVWVKVPVDTAAMPDPTVLTAQATVSGGGAVSTVAAPTTVSAALPPPGLLAGSEGLNAAAIGADGSPAGRAGRRPQQLNVNLGLPIQSTGAGGVFIPVGTLHDTRVDLPPGLIVNPAATPKCTEVQFRAFSCPASSQVGLLTVPLVGGVGLGAIPSPLYNMVPPPGQAAELAADIQNVPVHILGGVGPSDVPGRYRITSLTPDSISFLAVSSARLQLWGSPSDESHDGVRGECGGRYNGRGLCPVTREDTPLLGLPTSCTGSTTVDAAVDLWEDLGNFLQRSAQLRDANGNATPVSGCDALGPGFRPTLEARPTTSSADSPSGLSVDLHIPQTDSVSESATAHLRKAVVSLPQGMALNPSSANGLEGCTSSQIGIDLSTGVPDESRPTCPDAAKIGNVEVDTPLLEHALPGSVYVAQPYDNPFDSLLAIYIVVDDPISGTLIKLAGHVVPDPQTGRLVTTFDENPQLPFTDFKLSFFGGPGAVLRTPSVCGTYSTTSVMTPWSAPESGPPATPSDSYPITGGCSASEGAEPNKPEFEAGAVNPVAGKYTPFVIRLRREDGSQQFSQVTVTPPPGFTGKLAGIPSCPDAALATAEGKSGNDEKAHPSCPDASKIGIVNVAAGAGPAPYWTQGTAYLTGPYKGAPLSMAIITPATAGPYDLGTVVTRVALHVDPVTTQITADADPIPSILKGIPLDVRQVNVSLDRENFSRTGTSCEPMSINGTLISTLGQSAGLTNPFQLANCANLEFAPKLALRLKGRVRRTSHPRLIATLTAKEGEANIARAQVKLPPAAFIDQGHIRTVCTRVQWAANACPAGSVYGKVSATTPLLDYALTGSVYLRSSNHKLPDLVAKLSGPASQPIEVDLDGKTDAVKGALRNTFEAVPDAPVSKFRLELFGGKRGLIEMSNGFCKSRKATARFNGHNGAVYKSKPVVAGKCPKKHKGKKHRAHKKGSGAKKKGR